MPRTLSTTMVKVLVIVGPTAVGKSALAVKMAHLFDGEVISGDSMQIYQDLNVGTATVTPAEMEGIPHHLINILPLTQNYSAHDFQVAAKKCIVELAGRKKLPIICGGTGLYIQALVENYSLGTGEKKVVAEAQLDNEPTRWETLAFVDPKLAATTHPNNTRRIERALSRGQNSVGASSDDYLIIGLNTNREQLYERINQRVDIMIGEGLLAEARLVYEAAQAADHPLTSAQSIGYKEFFPYFKGEQSLEDAVELVKRNSRRYAKRQLTWFNNRMHVEFFDLLNDPTALQTLEQKITTWLKGGTP